MLQTCKPYINTRFGETPLHLSEQPDITTYLISEGADVNAIDKYAYD